MGRGSSWWWSGRRGLRRTEIPWLTPGVVALSRQWERLLVMRSEDGGWAVFLLVRYSPLRQWERLLAMRSEGGGWAVFLLVR